MPVIPVNWEAEVELCSQAGQGKSARPYLRKQLKAKQARDVTQMVEHRGAKFNSPYLREKKKKSN